ncbi:monocarboxylate transporter [Elysia marginata]|uniref:Monocarboxylate transporter n=1 Tax=Elysia marginata TaxID=1093978 RepID=A0AAV4I7M3_9GAST|nr:monocarboxylate transporter [Elysia marginata]
MVSITIDGPAEDSGMSVESPNVSSDGNAGHGKFAEPVDSQPSNGGHDVKKDNTMSASVEEHGCLDSSHNLNEDHETWDPTSKEKPEPPHDSEESLNVPEGGYGWVIVLGSFIVHVLMGGLGRSDGLFFLMFRNRFDESATLTAWPLAVVSVLRLGMGPIASAICQRWSVRACCMIGGLLLGLSHILAGFSPNFPVLFASCGFLQGIGRGLLYGPSLILVNMYFDRRRSFATGVAASGVGVGTLLVVPLIQLFFDTFSFTGGFLVLGGVCFNAVLVAMMFRPLSMYYKFKGKKGYNLAVVWLHP